MDKNVEEEARCNRGFYCHLIRVITCWKIGALESYRL
jgi:hypothetical protein